MRRAARRLVKWLCYRSFGTAYRFERAAAVRRARTEGPVVVVFQKGKMGSVSVRMSLDESDPRLRVYHVHVLNPDHLERTKASYRESFARSQMIPRHLLSSEIVRGILDGESGRIRVVTLTRDPVARQVSSFFQVMARKAPREVYCDRIARPDRPGLIDELTEQFLEEAKHDSSLVWFEEELEPVFGVDVYASPFPRETGYASYFGERADVLLIRVEDLERVAGEAFRRFLDLDEFAYRPANIAEEKDYHELYRAFRRRARLPLSFLDEMYGARYTRHFYSDEEIASFREPWVRPRAED